MRKMMLAFLVGCFLFSGCSGETSKGYTILFDDMPSLYGEQIYDNGAPVGRIVQKEVNPAGQVRVVAVFEEDWLRRANENIVFYPRYGHLQAEHLQRHGAPLPKDAAMCGFASRNGMIWFKMKTLISDRGAEARKKARELQARFGAL